MSTGTVIVQDSYRLIGAHSLAATASAESLAVGLRNLNAMLHLWLTRNIKIGNSPLEAIGDELNETADSFYAITSNLAIILAPNFDNGKIIVSPTLMALASTSLQYIKDAYLDITIPDKVVSATLPRGQGSRLFFSNSIFFGGGGTLNDEADS